jgi:hypothetical protein
MPILVMALLALFIFGTIGILLVVAVIMEHSPGEHPARRHFPHSEISDVAPSDQSSKEKAHEHALVGQEN